MRYIIPKPSFCFNKPCSKESILSTAKTERTNFCSVWFFVDPGTKFNQTSPGFGSLCEGSLPLFLLYRPVSACCSMEYGRSECSLCVGEGFRWNKLQFMIPACRAAALPGAKEIANIWHYAVCIHYNIVIHWICGSAEEEDCTVSHTCPNLVGACIEFGSGNSLTKQFISGVCF